MAEDLFTIVDGNQDGKVTESELQYFKGTKDFKFQSSSGEIEIEKMLACLRDKLIQIDESEGVGNGKVSRSDITHALKSASFSEHYAPPNLANHSSEEFETEKSKS